MQQQSTFQPPTVTQSPRPSRPSGPASGGPASLPISYGHKPSTENVGHTIVDRASGLSMPSVIGYATASLIFLFGAGGTLFSDMPGEIGVYIAVSVDPYLGKDETLRMQIWFSKCFAVRNSRGNIRRPIA